LKLLKTELGVNDRELRAGVIGAGAFGAHHARKLSRTPGVTLTAVFDRHLTGRRLWPPRPAGPAATT
jgi:predicted homoserine dehydrogenase-like protein